MRYHLVATVSQTILGNDRTGKIIEIIIPVGNIIQTIIWDGISPHTPPSGTKLVLAEETT